MPLDLFEKVLADYSALGGGYLTLTPITGDILLDKHLLERLEIVKRYPKITEIGVTTNAAMLDRFTDSEVRTIVQSFRKLQISIYGLDEEEYFAMTQRKTYHRAVDGIRRILAADSGNVYLSFRLLRERPWKELQRWALDVLGCKPETKFNSIMMGDYANFLVLDTSKPLPYGAKWREPKTAAEKSQCLVPILGASVSTTGEVSICSCVDNAEDLRIGNIAEDSLGDIYNSATAVALWDWASHGIPASCAKCTFYQPIDAIIRESWVFEDPFRMAGA